MSWTQAELDQALPAMLPGIHRFLRGKTKNADEIDDIVQETALKAYRHRDHLPAGAELKPYLYTIALNELRQRHRRKGRFEALLERYQSAPRTERASILDELNALLSILSPSIHDNATLALLALHHCLQWPARRIAAVLNEKPERIGKRLQRALEKARASTATAATGDLARDLFYYHYWIRVVMIDAMHPSQGGHFRHAAMVHEMRALAGLLLLRHGEHPVLLMQMAEACFLSARLAEYANDAQPTRPMTAWRRELWDRQLIHEAKRYHRKFHEKLPHSGLPPDDKGALLFSSDFNFLLHAPESHDAIDWRALRELCQRRMRQRPKPELHPWVAVCLRQEQGALASLRYLERWRGNRDVEAVRDYWSRLAEYNELLGRWKPAVTCLRRLLKFPLTDDERRALRQRLEECHRKSR